MDSVGTMLQAVREHVDALFSACMVVHVNSFLREVCKQILSADCSLREGWKQVWKESILIIIEVSIRRKVAQRRNWLLH